MKATTLARLICCLALLIAFVVPTVATAHNPGRARYCKSGLHRPVYKHYQPGCHWLFQQR